MVIFPLKMVIFPLKMVIFPLKMVIFPLKIVIFPLNMVIFPLKMVIWSGIPQDRSADLRMAHQISGQAGKVLRDGLMTCQAQRIPLSTYGGVPEMIT